MEKKDKILVIIPAYNEEKTIKLVITGIRQNLKDADILVVDDASSDSTKKIAQICDVFVISHSINLGPGSATQTGYKYAKLKNYDYVVQMDADGQHPPENINLLLNELKIMNMDIVIGSRFLKPKRDNTYKPPIIRRIGMFIFAKLASFITGQKITDTTSCFRALNKKTYSFLADIDYPDDFQDADVLIFLKLANFKIREVGVDMKERLAGSSMMTKTRIIYYIYKMLLSIMINLLRKKPNYVRVED